ncbi:hypothetical protein [Pantoea sp. Fr+CA_20]|uniref:hypothetical protein n=1 Tax=Pantoea TaxID=53335 RepID=UPI0021196DA8|nr:hypothetical protein [Pantoea sp. Fr+CA_20]
MNDYLLPFYNIFDSIIKTYDFDVKSSGDDTIFLVNDSYQIEFIMWRETVEINFCLIKSHSHVLSYYVRNFIATYITDDDRVVEYNIVSIKGSFVYIRNLKSLSYFSNALKNHFPSMLEGRMDWLEAYEKSEWYSEPRIEKRKV